MKGKATVLCENSIYSQVGAIAEHGWAVYIETDKGNFLFDTGQGKAIINNALFFKKDLSKIKGIIISHNHIDHTGGLLSVLEQTGNVEIHSHPGLFNDSYIFEGKNYYRYIGIPFREEILKAKGAKFKFNTNFRAIISDMMLSGEIPRKTPFEKGDNRLFIKRKEGYVKDVVVDDQTLILNTDKGLVIILGCSHSGIINILNYIINKTGQTHIHTIIGGTHLGVADNETLDRSIDALKHFDIENIGVSHCTGLKASAKLYQEFGNRFFFCNVGHEIDI